MGLTENRCQICGKVIPSGLLKCLSCSLNLMSKGNKARWRCRVCGDRIDTDRDVCVTCGTNFGHDDKKGEEDKVGLDAKAGVEFEEEYVCMICNHPVDRKARKCEFCGTVFYEKGETKYGPVVERVDRKRVSRASPSTG
jgi:DNA-directed RNA polymerase subunit RPC12/RpoP